ncbi:leucine-rich repeat extensin-like protein 3 [Iris pallida]|uniref:Leucine-rich repeat extensin-like protein 3 n=1 Tax=Iris pallida TaxID=29817 RepID=A0AAX6HMQ5_IRIPA|nr:leucine-rich repeat extensin-like protein 3 [Iris pallida]
MTTIETPRRHLHDTAITNNIIAATATAASAKSPPLRLSRPAAPTTVHPHQNQHHRLRHPWLPRPPPTPAPAPRLVRRHHHNPHRRHRHTTLTTTITMAGPPHRNHPFPVITEPRLYLSPGPSCAASAGEPTRGSPPPRPPPWPHSSPAELSAERTPPAPKSGVPRAPAKPR